MNLVCFADERMSISQNRCIESALKHGIKSFWKLAPKDIDPYYAKLHNENLQNEKGAGLWCWKPYFIDLVLNNINENDILFYSDAGIEIINNLNYIGDRMNKEGIDIFLFSGRFPHYQWCKMDVIQAMNHTSLSFIDTQSGPMYSMNGYESFLQVQASNMFFRATPNAKKFVREWLLWCAMPHFIDDSPSEAPNHPTFQASRHDQQVITCLQIKYKLPLHWFCSSTNEDKKRDFPNDNYPALFNHHRKRNDEW